MRQQTEKRDRPPREEGLQVKRESTDRQRSEMEIGAAGKNEEGQDDTNFRAVYGEAMVNFVKGHEKLYDKTNGLDQKQSQEGYPLGKVKVHFLGHPVPVQYMCHRLTLLRNSHIRW